MPTSEWHWDQGTKFAVEGIKTSLLLNGAAAVALLTFVANTKSISRCAVAAVVLFALGAVASTLAFVCAYWTQLEYGNAEIPGADKARIWKKGQRRNACSVIMVLLSVVLFFAGVVVAVLAIRP